MATVVAGMPDRMGKADDLSGVRHWLAQHSSPGAAVRAKLLAAGHQLESFVVAQAEEVAADSQQMGHSWDIWQVHHKADGVGFPDFPKTLVEAALSQKMMVL